MKQGIVRALVLVALVGAAAPGLRAEEAKDVAAKALPTLLIKGEVVSVDSNDPSAALLKVKDRYGFETPIYVRPDTKIMRGNQAIAVADLQPGTPLEVEYNFDINTAKRHAAKITVNVPASTATAAPAAPVAIPDPVAPAASDIGAPVPEAPVPAEEPVAPPAETEMPAESTDSDSTTGQ